MSDRLDKLSFSGIHHFHFFYVYNVIFKAVIFCTIKMENKLFIHAHKAVVRA